MSFYPPPSNLNADPGNLFESLPIDLLGEATDGTGEPIPSSGLSWRSSLAGSLGSGATLRWTTAPPGQQTLTLEARDARGLAGLDSITIRVRPAAEIPPLVATIDSPAAEAGPFYATMPLALAGHAVSGRDGPVPDARLGWFLDGQPLPGSGGAMTLTTLLAGEHYLTFRAVESTGATSTVTRLLQVLGEAALPAPTVILGEPADGRSFYETLPIRLSGWAHDLRDGELPDESLAWQSSRDGLLGTGRSLVLSNLLPGAITLSLTARNARSQEASASVTVTIRSEAEIPSPALWITSPSPETVAYETLPLLLAGTATSLKDGFLEPSRLSWTLEDGRLLGIGSDLTVTTCPAGDHVLTCWARDSRGRMSSVTQALSVRPLADLPLPDVQIVSPDAGGAFYESLPIGLLGFASDPAPGVGTVALEWSFDGGAPISAGASATLTAPAAGSQRLRLTARDTLGRAASAAVTVAVRPWSEIPPPSVALDSPLDGSTWYRTMAIPLAATASDLVEGALPPERLEWSSDRESGWTTRGAVAVATLTTGLHVLQARALTSRGAAGTATVAIRILPLSEAPPPVLRIDSPRDGEPFVLGDAIPLGVSATDVVEPVLDNAAFVWSAAGAEVAVGQAASFTPSTTGPVALAVRCTTARGATGVATVSIVVSPPLPPPGSRHVPDVTIAVPGSGTEVVAGAPLGLTGSARVSSEGAVPDSRLLWSSDLEGVLGAGGERSVRLIRPGNHRIALWATSARGVTGSSAVSIAVSALASGALAGLPPPTVQIELPVPEGRRVAVGQTLHMGASATDFVEGGLPDNRFVWRSAAFDGPVLSSHPRVVLTTAPGVYAVRAEAWTVRGAVGSDTVRLTVVDPQSPSPPRIEIAAPPPGIAVPFGTMIEMTGSSFSDADGDLSSVIRWFEGGGPPIGVGASLVWPARTVTPELLLRATVTDSRGRTSEASVTIAVLPPVPALRVTKPAAGWRALPGEPVEFEAEGDSGDRTPLEPASLRWTVDSTLEVGSGQTIVTSALPLGVHRIEVTGTSRFGVSTSAAVEVVVTSPAPVVTIFEPRAGQRVDYYRPVALVGQAVIPVSNPRSLPSSSMLWVADGVTPLGRGASFTTTALTTGPHEIELRVVDASGTAAAASVSIVVDPAAADACDTGDVRDMRPIRISVTQPVACHGEAHATAGSRVWLQATAVDHFEGELPGFRMSWSSDLVGPIGAGQTLSTTGLTVGRHLLTVSAQAERGVSGSTTLAVDVSSPPGPTVHILSPPPFSSVPVYEGVPIDLRAWAFSFADARTREEGMTWRIDGIPVASGLESRVTAPAGGEHVLEARYTDSTGNTGWVTQPLASLDPRRFEPLCLSVSRFRTCTDSEEALAWLTRGEAVWEGVGSDVREPLYASDAAFGWSVGGTAASSVTATLRFAGPELLSRLWKSFTVIGLASRKELVSRSLAQCAPASYSVALTLPSTKEPMLIVALRDGSIGWQQLTQPCAIQLDLTDARGDCVTAPVVLPLLPRQPTTPKIVENVGDDKVVVPVGAPFTLSVLARDEVDGPLAGAAIRWFVAGSEESWVSEGQGVSITGTALPGPRRYRVGATNSWPESVTTYRTVLGLMPPRVSIAATPPVSWVFAGSPVRLEARVDWESGVPVPETIAWSSDRQGLLATETMVTIAPLEPGFHTFVVRVAGPAGLATTASWLLAVVAPPRVTDVSAIDEQGAAHALDIGAGGARAVSERDWALRVTVANPSQREMELTVGGDGEEPELFSHMEWLEAGAAGPVTTLPLTRNSSGALVVRLPAGTPGGSVALVFRGPAAAKGASLLPPRSFRFGLSGGGAFLPVLAVSALSGNRPRSAADDVDGDEVPNAVELENRTDPFASDTDGDGLDDAAELSRPSRSSANLADSDGDLRVDGVDDAPRLPGTWLMLRSPDRKLREWRLSCGFYPFDRGGCSRPTPWALLMSGVEAYGTNFNPPPILEYLPAGYYGTQSHSYPELPAALEVITALWWDGSGPYKSGTATGWNSGWTRGAGLEPVVSAEYPQYGAELIPGMGPESSGEIWGCFRGGVFLRSCGAPMYWKRRYHTFCQDFAEACVPDPCGANCARVIRPSQTPGCETAQIGSMSLVGVKGRVEVSTAYWPIDSPGAARIVRVADPARPAEALPDDAVVDTQGAGIVVSVENGRDERNPVRLRLGSPDEPIAALLWNTGRTELRAGYLDRPGSQPSGTVDQAILPVPNGMSKFYFPRAGAEGRVELRLETKRHDGRWEQKGHRTVRFVKFPKVVDLRRLPADGPLESIYQTQTSSAGPVDATVYDTDRYFQFVFDGPLPGPIAIAVFSSSLNGGGPTPPAKTDWGRMRAAQPGSAPASTVLTTVPAGATSGFVESPGRFKPGVQSVFVGSKLPPDSPRAIEFSTARANIREVRRVGLGPNRDKLIDRSQQVLQVRNGNPLGPFAVTDHPIFPTDAGLAVTVEKWTTRPVTVELESLDRRGLPSFFTTTSVQLTEMPSEGSFVSTTATFPLTSLEYFMLTGAGDRVSVRVKGASTELQPAPVSITGSVPLKPEGIIPIVVSAFDGARTSDMVAAYIRASNENLFNKVGVSLTLAGDRPILALGPSQITSYELRYGNMVSSNILQTDPDKGTLANLEELARTSPYPSDAIIAVIFARSNRFVPGDPLSFGWTGSIVWAYSYSAYEPAKVFIFHDYFGEPYFRIPFYSDFAHECGHTLFGSDHERSDAHNVMFVPGDGRLGPFVINREPQFAHLYDWLTIRPGRRDW